MTDPTIKARLARARRYDERTKMTEKLLIKLEREDDGRWLADVTSMKGVMAYGDTVEAATRNVKVLALHAMAHRLGAGQYVPELDALFGVLS